MLPGPARALALLPLLAGCAHPVLPDPGAAVVAWTRTVERDDPHAAYGLLSAAARAELTEPAFTAEWRASVPERRSQAELLRKPSWIESAQVASSGRVSPLVRQPSGWRLKAPKSVEVGPTSPEEALRRFFAALESRNFDAFVRLLGEPLRGVVERELAERVKALSSVLDKRLTVEGDTVRLRYDARHHLDLKRENGQWQVADFN